MENIESYYGGLGSNGWIKSHNLRVSFSQMRNRHNQQSNFVVTILKYRTKNLHEPLVKFILIFHEILRQCAVPCYRSGNVGYLLGLPAPLYPLAKITLKRDEFRSFFTCTALSHANVHATSDAATLVAYIVHGMEL